MKKIKYLLLILPFLFIKNVKAECTNYVDLTSSDNNYISAGLTINSRTSLTISNSNDNQQIIRYFTNPGPNTYILSFDITDISSNWNPALLTWERKVFFSLNSSNEKYINENLTENLSSSSRFLKYKITIPSGVPDYYIFFYANSITTSDILKIDNMVMYKESEYDSCINPISQPTTYTYTFKVDNEIYATDTVNEGTNVVLPTPPTKEGYTFTGWTLNGESYTGGEIHSNIEIIATFTENQVEPTPEPETSSETPEIDVSGLVPYLLLIAALLMLIILRDFIKNLFKSRR